MSEEEKLLKEAKKFPWEDRLLHNNSKVRYDANNDLAALCESITNPKHPRIRDLGLPWKLAMQLWQNALWCSCFGSNWRMWMYSFFDVNEQSYEVSQSISETVFTRENFTPSRPQMERHPLAQAINMVNVKDSNKDEREKRFIVPKLQVEQIPELESVQGMKVVCHRLNDHEGSLMDDLVKDVDRLVSLLADKVAKAFEFCLMDESSRFCKYVLNTLMLIFQNKRLAHVVNVTTLDNLIPELLLWILDERVPSMNDGKQLLKALNVLMLKILDNAERTSLFVVLIGLLKPLDPSRWPSSPSNESCATRNFKFHELITKCLIKLTKMQELDNTIHEVKIDLILQSIHVYFQDLGIEEMRKRTGEDDMSLRIVKTVLYLIVRHYGTFIKHHLSLVPIHMEPQPIILSLIDLNLQTLVAATMLRPFGDVGQSQTHMSDSIVNDSRGRILIPVRVNDRRNDGFRFGGSNGIYARNERMKRMLLSSCNGIGRLKLKG